MRANARDPFFSNFWKCFQQHYSLSEKKFGHMFCSISHKISVLQENHVIKGQNDLFQKWKWSIVCLWSSNIFGDTPKNIEILTFWLFVKIDEVSIQNRENSKIDTFLCLAISRELIELQRCTIPHFNPWNKLFWPLFL